MANQNRREFLAQTAALGGMTLPSPSASGDVAVGSKRPNLVYIFADQLRYFSCGYAGDEYARTPHIDRLAAQGCNFHQAISSTPVCAPYRASLFTGKYQSSTGMVINELRLSPEHECLGHVLTRNKYRTAYIGKWHLWANELGHHELTRNAFVPPGPYRLGFDGLWQAYNFNHEYYNSPYFENDTDRHIRKQYEPDGQTEVAIRFLEEAGKANEPFALFVSWGPPHDPWDQKNVRPDDLELFNNITLPKRPNYSDTPDPYADEWARIGKEYPNQVDQFQRTYYAQSAGIDRCVGRIMDALDNQGLAENTILVFTSDHGEMFGAHGRRAKYIFLRRGCTNTVSRAMARPHPGEGGFRRTAWHARHYADPPVADEPSHSEVRGGRRFEWSCVWQVASRARSSASTRYGNHRSMDGWHGVAGDPRS